MLGMLGNPKKVASFIIASSPRKDSEGSSYREKDEIDKSSDDFDMIAEEMISRLEEKDPKGLASCLKSLFYNLESRIKGGESEMMDDEEEM